MFDSKSTSRNQLTLPRSYRSGQAGGNYKPCHIGMINLPMFGCRWGIDELFYMFCLFSCEKHSQSAVNLKLVCQICGKYLACDAVNTLLRSPEWRFCLHFVQHSCQYQWIFEPFLPIWLPSFLQAAEGGHCRPLQGSGSPEERLGYPLISQMRVKISNRTNGTTDLIHARRSSAMIFFVERNNFWLGDHHWSTASGSASRLSSVESTPLTVWVAKILFWLLIANLHFSRQIWNSATSKISKTVEK